MLALCLVCLCWGLPLQAQDWTKATFTELQQAAERGDAIAQFVLGGKYLQGEGVDKNERQAVAWFRKSAEKGFGHSQAVLGSMYLSGQGVAQDDRQAVAWYRKAAEQGYDYAQAGLGNLYATGRGVVQDFRLAYIWYSVAVANGYADAAPARDFLVDKLTPSALAEAQIQAGEYFEKYPSKE